MPDKEIVKLQISQTFISYNSPTPKLMPYLRLQNPYHQLKKVRGECMLLMECRKISIIVKILGFLYLPYIFVEESILVFLKHKNHDNSSQRRNTCLKISVSCNQISNYVEKNLCFILDTELAHADFLADMAMP